MTIIFRAFNLDSQHVLLCILAFFQVSLVHQIYGSQSGQLLPRDSLECVRYCSRITNLYHMPSPKDQGFKNRSLSQGLLHFHWQECLSTMWYELCADVIHVLTVRGDSSGPLFSLQDERPRSQALISHICNAICQQELNQSIQVTASTLVL